MKRIENSRIGEQKIEEVPDVTELDSLEDRVNKIFRIVNKKDRSATDMLFFVMYDIESTKVRNQVAKYLIQKGCHRIQKSIFLANIGMDSFQQIKNDLSEIQSFYDNVDSILLVPISSDYLQSMKIIGKSIDIDVITRSRNTLFF